MAVKALSRLGTTASEEQNWLEGYLTLPDLSEQTPEVEVSQAPRLTGAELNIEAVDTANQELVEIFHRVPPPHPRLQPFSITRLDREYRQLTKSPAPFARKDERERRMHFWRMQGEFAFSWLCTKLRNETDVDNLDSVASVLAFNVERSLPAIIQGLASPGSHEQLYALLSSLGRAELHGAPSQIGSLTTQILRYIVDPNPAVRERAVVASRVLPVDTALGLLRARLGNERSEEVRQEIQEMIEELSGQEAK